MADFFEALPRPTKKYHSMTYDRISPKNSSFHGNGKTVAITGGASGIGSSIVRAFAEAGVSRVAIISRSSGPQQELKKYIESAYSSTKVVCYQASIDDSIAMESIFQELGSIDVLTLNATALDKKFDHMMEVTPEEMGKVFNTNVTAAFGLIKNFLQLPMPSGGGKKTLINISSAAAHMVVPNSISYGPSKAAITQVVTHLASEQSSQEVQMFSFNPGVHSTVGSRELFGTEGFEYDDIALPGDFAVWLAGSESAFLNGRMLWAHWDVDELIALKEKIAEDPSLLTIGFVQ